MFPVPAPFDRGHSEFGQLKLFIESSTPMNALELIFSSWVLNDTMDRSYDRVAKVDGRSTIMAGDKQFTLVTGTTIAPQLLRMGAVDELQIAVMPGLLGSTALFRALRGP